jgi:regulator of PEP synthase PpsR (kinase-PPPase family)
MCIRDRLSLNEGRDTTYTDRKAITQEILDMRKLCSANSWPVIDVTRRSIEETAAAVLNLLNQKLANRSA